MNRDRTRPVALAAAWPWRLAPSLPPAAATTARRRGGGDADSLTVWIVEDLPDRVAATQEIVDAFTEESGIEVELVAVAEDQFNQILTSNAAAGDLPDVIGGMPLGPGPHAVGQRARRHRGGRRGARRPRRRARSARAP